MHFNTFKIGFLHKNTRKQVYDLQEISYLHGLINIITLCLLIN